MSGKSGAERIALFLAVTGPGIRTLFSSDRRSTVYCAPKHEKSDLMIDPFSSEGSILLLASDPPMREILSEKLTSGAYLVEVANDLGQAVDRLSEMLPDLLIVRPYIESMTGEEAVRYLRSKHPGLPALIVGGFLEDDRIETLNSVHGIQVFPKPFRADELLAKVGETILAHRPKTAALKEVQKA
jgi:DNA-binding response OmpR family regulator